MESMTLYDIDNAIRDFEFEIDEETGEVLNYDELDALQIAREQKIEGVGLWVKELERLSAGLKAEENTLKERRRVTDNKIERLKNYLVYAQHKVRDGEDIYEKFSTTKVSIGFRTSESVNITNEALIPEKYFRVTVKKEPDKTAIKAAIKADEEVMGAEVVKNTSANVK